MMCALGEKSQPLRCRAVLRDMHLVHCGTLLEWILAVQGHEQYSLVRPIHGALP